MNIYHYLQAIKQDRPINAVRLKSLLQAKGLSLNTLGQLEYLAPGKYRVHAINQQTLSHWLELFAPAISRKDAALRAKDSHQHRTAALYLIAKKRTANSPDFVIKCMNEQYSSHQALTIEGQSVVLIENSECYTYHTAFLSNLALDGCPDDSLVIWSNGRAIGHPGALNVLRQAKAVYYCPDYDLGGIEIYEILFKHLRQRLSFVMPAEPLTCQELCHPPKDSSQFLKAIYKARQLGLTALEDLLISGNGFLEQEQLIGDIK